MEVLAVEVHALHALVCRLAVVVAADLQARGRPVPEGLPDPSGAADPHERHLTLVSPR